MEWLVFLVIIGIVSSVIGKNKPANRPVQRSFDTSPNEPRTSNSKMDWDDDVDDKLRDLERKLTGWSTWGEEERTDPYHSQKDRYAKSTVYKEEVKQTQEGTSLEYKDIGFDKLEDTTHAYDIEEAENTHIVNPNKAVQGMIWSEIFGPPRSKRPHYALVSKRNN